MKVKLGHRLKGRMARTLVVMFLLLTVFFLLVIRTVSTAEIKRFALSEIEAQHREVGDGIVMILDEINLLYARMVLHDDFLLVLEDQSLTFADKEHVFRRMMDRVGVNEALFGDIVLYFQDEFYRMADWRQSSLPDAAFLNRIVNSERLIEQGNMTRDRDGNAYVMIGKRMVNFPTGNVTGAVIFYIREEVIKDVTSIVSQGRGYSLILADGENIITHTLHDAAGKTLFDASAYGLRPQSTDQARAAAQTRELEGQRVMVITHELSSLSERYSLNWVIVSVIDHDALFGDVARLDRTIVSIGVVLAVAAALLSVGLSAKITRPIDRIVQRLRRFTATGEKERAPSAVRDELWELESTYDDMIDRISDLIRTNQEKAETQRKLELDALQMQINPHFLYNTLDAIAWMAKLKKQPEIAQLAIALAKFFRISLHKGDKYITVAQEIDLIRNFIAIELIRFPDKFDIDISVDPEVENEMTLKLILQPIVENAIKHGVSLLDKRGRIEIKAYGHGEYVRFEVSDDGAGFDPSDNLLSESPGDGISGGYGLKNVNERLKLEYGPDCGIQVDSTVGGGTRVTLTIRRSSAASWSAAESAVS